MSKNIVPLIIVLAVIFIGGVGIFLLSNQKNLTSDINVNPTPYPTTSAIISTPMPQASVGANMNNIITTESGLKIQDLVVGNGNQVKSGDTVAVHYIGTLESGTKFDSSYDRSTPFITPIGVGQVIKGWDEGIVGMKVGGKRKLIIPPSLGYGEQGAGSAIPPNSTLVFEVELLEVK